ncbi:zinc finger and BTB domain-containing protein 5 [Grus japonensis]|uniref:Zinc finger and BTB domain-containing protein 5 n=1 Tax=Grus japonensis TaxID=30415 RepID=A0ABC9WET8_GRUJA
MEDPTPEQVEAPEGGCGLWEAHAGASSWQDLGTRGERSPRRSRFAGRTCDSVGDPCWSSLLLKVCTSWKGPTLEQFVKNCSPWEGLTLEKFMEVSRERDPKVEQGKNVRSPPPEEEGVAETMCDQLTITPIPHPPVPLRGRR